jgi:spermidine synthase
MVSGEFPIFSFICDNASQTRLIAGDGRLKIKEAPANYYDLILLDAFSSDAIPMHLITNEAVQTYLQCLQPDGVLALHVTNRYLNLLPVLKKIAEANDLKTLSLYHTQRPASDKQPKQLFHHSFDRNSHLIFLSFSQTALD